MLNQCPNHRRKAARRGVCLTCYRTYAQRVSRGLTTWDALQAEGLILPPQPRGRKRMSGRPV